MARLDIKNCTITILDGTGTPNTCVVKIGEGNLTWSEKKPREYLRERGVLDAVRDGDQEPMDLSIECRWDFYFSHTGSGETVNPIEAIKKAGNASSWVTTGADPCAPYAVDIRVDQNISCGTVYDERLLFEEFRYEQIDGDLRAATLSVSGKCNSLAPTSTRTIIT